MESEKVKYLINMINDMDIKDKLRLAICMSQSKWSGLIYNTKENYEKFDTMLKDIDDSFKHFKGMSELLKKFGYDSSSKILNTRTRKAGYKFSKIFDVSEDTEIFQVLRLRLGNEQPISIENTYILHDSIPDIENIDFQIYSLYDLFRTNNIKIHDISHAFSTTKVHNTDARFLNLENDTSVIYVDITSSLIDNQVVEYTEVLVRPEFSKYYTDGIFKNGIYQVNAQVVI